jgi:cyclopropane-fatty-acyl-phospholipid synthase
LSKHNHVYLISLPRNYFLGFSVVCAGDRFPLEATITIHHPRFYSSIVFGGSVGASEAFMAGQWSTDDLTTVVRITILNREVFEGMEKGLAKLTAPLHMFVHRLRGNTRKGSRLNIAAHYDLGNDFYKLFLDETLTYSCNIFECHDSTLKEASLAKYHRICQKLELSSQDHVVEIGSGWGGFAIYAAQKCGCRITTTTISSAQHDLVKERIDKAGVAHRVELLLEDYRDLKGKYDKLVSIEMIEAVGHQYFNTFFRSCSKLLKEDGMMLLQAITMTDQVFDRHKRNVDFIKRYIFPGSCIPSITAMSRSIARASDLKLFHLEDITPHYARTLRTWRERFFANIDKVQTKCAIWACRRPLFACGIIIFPTARQALPSATWVTSRCFLPNPFAVAHRFCLHSHSSTYKIAVVNYCFIKCSFFYIIHCAWLARFRNYLFCGV